MPPSTFESWGRVRPAEAVALRADWRSDPLPAPPPGRTLLPYGLGRSYGDSCLNDGHAMLATRGLDRFIAFDPDNGILRAEAGVSFDEILRLVVPRGWFVPVTPGTKYVTLGGAIANDVHGKNHHHAGTFGRHVTRFELLRSDGSRLECSPTENADWFGATIGGLGLTGLVTWAEFRLKKIASARIDEETIRFGNLDEFLAIDAESAGTFDYTVSWADVCQGGASLGRGLYMRGNHAPASEAPLDGDLGRTRVTVPFVATELLINRTTIRAFNTAYYFRKLRRRSRHLVRFDPFFYPLDGIGRWNRLHGRRGFFQFQCVLPPATARDALREMLTTIAASREGSFINVLKGFGTLESPGWLSFPRPGMTLAMDFPNRGERTAALLDRLDAINDAAGGALYPAKDARMTPAQFRRAFPRWEQFAAFVDPRFSSDFWRRVTA